MNREMLTAKVAEKTGLKKKYCAQAVNATFEAIEEALGAGEKVQILGFGTFETRSRSARKGRNPQTGEVIDIPATTIPAFKAGSNFKAVVK